MATAEDHTPLKRASIAELGGRTRDLAGRYPQIRDEITQQTGFVVDAQIGKSTWWGGKIGAVMYRGRFAVAGTQISAVLKIEAVQLRPDEITETAMIRKAAQALAGSGIRPPNVYQEISWTENHGGYAAVIMEDVLTDRPVLPVPGMTIAQIDEQWHMWQQQYDTFLATRSAEDERLFTLARIERLAAGLNLDALTISADPENGLARYTVEQTRKDLAGFLDSVSY